MEIHIINKDKIPIVHIVFINFTTLKMFACKLHFNRLLIIKPKKKLMLPYILFPLYHFTIKDTLSLRFRRKVHIRVQTERI